MAQSISKVYVDMVARTASFDGPVKKSKKNLQGFQKLIVSMKTDFAGFGLSMLKSVAPVAILTAGVTALTLAMKGLASSAINNFREGEKLRGMLAAITGGSKSAAIEFSRLQALATTLPDSIESVTRQFVKLENFGLDSSERALRSYSNTALALGKNLEQMVEAVTDASVAEFERFKEFGIKAKNLGDTISFRFGGQTTMVRNHADAIQEYLIKIGETKFANVINEQMGTMNFKLSQLQKAWFEFSNALVGDTPVGRVIKSILDKITEGIKDLNDVMAASEFASRIDVKKFFGPDVLKQLQGSGSAFNGEFQKIIDISKKRIEDLEETGAEFKINYDTGGSMVAIEAQERLLERAKKLARDIISAAQNRLALEQRGLDFAKTKATLDLDESKNQDRQTANDKRRELLNKTIAEHSKKIRFDALSDTEKQVELKEYLKQLELEIYRIQDTNTTNTTDEQIEKLGKAYVDVYSDILDVSERLEVSRKAASDALEKSLHNDSEALDDFNKSTLDRIKEDVDKKAKLKEDAQKKEEDLLAKTAKAMDRFNEKTARGLAESITSGKKFSEVIKDIGMQLIQAQLTKSISGMLGAFTGTGGMFNGLFKGLFRANGGPVNGGSSYVVGERGPELFTPTSSGSITSNAKMGQGARSGQNVLVNNYFDIRGSDEETQKMIASSVRVSVAMAVAEGQNLKNRGVIR